MAWLQVVSVGRAEMDGETNILLYTDATLTLSTESALHCDFRQPLVECIRELMKLSPVTSHSGKLPNQVLAQGYGVIWGEVLGRIWP